MYVCSHADCGKSFKTRNQLKAHIRGDSVSEMYSSRNAQSSNRDARAATRRSTPPLPDPADEQVPAADQQVQPQPQLPKLAAGPQIATGFTCSFGGCEEAFSDGDKMWAHAITHIDLTPFGCPTENCSLRFSTKEELIGHYLTHVSSV